MPEVEWKETQDRTKCTGQYACTVLENWQLQFGEPSVLSYDTRCKSKVLHTHIMLWSRALVLYSIQFCLLKSNLKLKIIHILVHRRSPCPALSVPVCCVVALVWDWTSSNNNCKHTYSPFKVYITKRTVHVGRDGNNCLKCCENLRQAKLTLTVNATIVRTSGDGTFASWLLNI